MKKLMIHKFGLILLIVLTALSLSLAGCGKSSGSTEDSGTQASGNVSDDGNSGQAEAAESQTAQQAENSSSQSTARAEEESNIYDVYYKLSDGTGLKTVSYQAQASAQAPEDLVRELMEQMKTQVPDDPTVTPSLNSDLEASDLEIVEDNTLKIDFAGAVRADNAADAVLTRAAFVLTMTQINGIDYVEISYDQVPVRDAGLYTTDKLSASDFIMEANDSLYAMNKSTMTLYFPNPAGDALYEVQKSVLYGGTASAEELVVQMLIDGPGDDGTRPVLPEDLEINDISVRDGVCYVDFSAEFLKKAQDLSPELIVYSIVNSLTALPDVTQVQITVNGNSDVSLMDTFSLNNVFSANLNYVVESPSGASTEEN